MIFNKKFIFLSLIMFNNILSLPDAGCLARIRHADIFIKYNDLDGAISLLQDIVNDCTLSIDCFRNEACLKLAEIYIKCAEYLTARDYLDMILNSDGRHKDKAQKLKNYIMRYIESSCAG